MFDIDQRINPLNIRFKKVRKTRINRKFDLKKSVFSHWFKDLDEEYKKCFEADM